MKSLNTGGNMVQLARDRFILLPVSHAFSETANDQHNAYVTHKAQTFRARGANFTAPVITDRLRYSDVKIIPSYSTHRFITVVIKLGTGPYPEDPEPFQPSSPKPPNPCHLAKMTYYMALTYVPEKNGYTSNDFNVRSLNKGQIWL